MKEEEAWVESIKELLEQTLSPKFRLLTKCKLPYTKEVLTYTKENNILTSAEGQEMRYETDLMIYEQVGNLVKPRIVIEAKYKRINTHEPIAYNHKATQHKAVTPYLRYGIMLGDMGQAHSLPGRLFRHGKNFDFMFSFEGAEATPVEKQAFVDLINSEWAASLQAEKLFFKSNAQGKKYFMLQNALRLQGDDFIDADFSRKNTGNLG